MSARRPWAWPLVPLYAAGQRLQQAVQAASRRLSRPVISIGSLSAGGAGKTPVVIALAELLKSRGWAVDGLSRGYGRASEGVRQVDTQRPDAAAMYGDEPVLIAARTGVPVWVGSSRFAAGHAAEAAWDGTERRSARAWLDENERQQARSAPAVKAETQLCGGPSVHLLDDGFQHRKLARDFDAVLVTADDLDDPLLPAGNRREPWSALRRADAVLVRLEERERVVPFVREHMRVEAKVWLLRRTLRFPAPLGVLSAGLRPLGVCAIARPEGFAAMVKDAGCGLVDTLAFVDHHAYTMRDIGDILRTAETLKASGFVTTEKDAVKLTPAMLERLGSVGPVVVAALEVEFADPDGVFHDLERAVA